MIGWLLKKAGKGGQSVSLKESGRSAPHPNCPVWNDIRRALDAKPKGTR